MAIAKNTVFLSGATGLAGVGIIQHILDCHPGIRIRGTRHSREPYLISDRVEYVRADLTKKTDCRAAVRGCNMAILAAANSGGAQSALDEPYRQMTDNIVIDVNVLEALYFEGITRIIYLSSAVVYQDFTGCIKEDQLDLNHDPSLAYLGVGWAKRSAEKICQFWNTKYGQEIIILRCANIYGPFDKFDPGKSNFIPAIIRKCGDKIEPFTVWGNPDITRDVIHVQDLAEAVLSLLFQTDIKFNIFNLGGGTPVTVESVVNLALYFAHHQPLKIEYDTGKPMTIKRRIINCGKIKKAIGWEPKIPIQNGIERTTQWWMENKSWWQR